MKRLALALGVTALAAAALTGCAPAHYSADDCTVVSKDRAGGSGGSSDMRVYTSNCGTFEVQDDPWHGYYNSGDTYGQILPGHHYRFTAYGYRNGFTSDFPNIVAAEDLGEVGDAG